MDTIISKSTFNYAIETPGHYYWRIDIKGNETDANIARIVTEDNISFTSRKEIYQQFMRELDGLPELWRETLLELYFEEHAPIIE